MKLSSKKIAIYLAPALSVSATEMEESFCKATYKDLNGILDLRREVLWKQITWDDEAYVRWRYFSDLKDDNCYWIFKNHEGIIGATGVEAFKLFIDGVLYDAFRGMDLMVRPDLNGKGLGAYMNTVLLEKYEIMIVVGANKNSRSMVSRLYKELKSSTKWFYGIYSEPILRKHLKTKLLSQSLSVFLNSYFSIKNRIYKIPIPKSLIIREIKTFDVTVTDLCLRLSKIESIFMHRSCDYLNWRFTEMPVNNQMVFGAFCGDKLVGYIVILLMRSMKRLPPKGIIVDWLCEGAPDFERSELLNLLLQTAIEYSKQNGAYMVSISTYDLLSEQVLKKVGFINKDYGSGDPLFVHSAHKQLSKRLFDDSLWFLTMCDSDLDIFP